MLGSTSAAHTIFCSVGSVYRVLGLFYIDRGQGGRYLKVGRNLLPLPSKDNAAITRSYFVGYDFTGSQLWHQSEFPLYCQLLAALDSLVHPSPAG